MSRYLRYFVFLFCKNKDSGLFGGFCTWIDRKLLLLKSVHLFFFFSHHFSLRSFPVCCQCTTNSRRPDSQPICLSPQAAYLWRRLPGPFSDDRWVSLFFFFLQSQVILVILFFISICMQNILKKVINCISEKQKNRNKLNIGSQFVTVLYGIGQTLGEELWLWR